MRCYFLRMLLRWYWNQTSAIHVVIGCQVEDHGLTARRVLGGIDAMKVKSCLTLFDAVSPNDIFGKCLDACYSGERDFRTLDLLRSY